jgi:hypothetical protein
MSTSQANSVRTVRNNASNDSAPSTSTQANQKAKAHDYVPVSTLSCKGFINCITEVTRNGDDGSNADTLYFARLSLVTGREKHGDQYRDRMQFIDILVGPRLRKLAVNVIANARLDDSTAFRADAETPGFPFKETLCHFTINDLFFSIFETDKPDSSSKPYLNTKGILSEISFH